MATLSSDPNGKPIRHILSLSGGKDSTALAIFMKGKIPNCEYIFCDTGNELPETYEYLDKLEVYLGQEIARLNPDRPFQHYLQVYRGVLPDARTRWCTRKLKIEPFEEYVGEDLCYSYIGIRADEMSRRGYISSKPNIIPQYPFIEAGIKKADVFRILEESGLGLPKYYDWRSRSGCYFCFFQQRIEWVGLLENHPDLFSQSSGFEKENPETGEKFTWVQNESLADLSDPERIQKIKSDHEKTIARKKLATNRTLFEVFSEKNGEHDSMIGEDDEGDEGCLICHL